MILLQTIGVLALLVAAGLLIAHFDRKDDLR